MKQLSILLLVLLIGVLTSCSKSGDVKPNKVNISTANINTKDSIVYQRVGLSIIAVPYDKDYDVIKYKLHVVELDTVITGFNAEVKTRTQYMYKVGDSTYVRKDLRTIIKIPDMYKVVVLERL